MGDITKMELKGIGREGTNGIYVSGDEFLDWLNESQLFKTGSDQ
jgi:hypothetical protein